MKILLIASLVVSLPGLCLAEEVKPPPMINSATPLEYKAQFGYGSQIVGPIHIEDGSGHVIIDLPKGMAIVMDGTPPNPYPVGHASHEHVEDLDDGMHAALLLSSYSMNAATPHPLIGPTPDAVLPVVEGETLHFPSNANTKAP